MQLRAATERLRAMLADIEARLAEVGREKVLAPLVGAPDVVEIWRAQSLGRKRAVSDMLMTVTILPAGKVCGSTPIRCGSTGSSAASTKQARG